MPLRIEKKHVIVEQVHAAAKDALSVVVADARGIDSNSMNNLRSEAYKNKVVLRVVKNSLAKRALLETDFECINEHLTGPSIFGFSMDHPGAAAKIFRSFAKEQESLSIKLLSIDGEFMEGQHVNKLADMPTHQEALTMLASVSIGPLRHLACGLNDVLTRFVRVTAMAAKTLESQS